MAATNFLQQHYEKCRLAGEEHINYVILNDLTDATAKELEDWFNKEHPGGVSKEKVEAMQEQVKKEVDEAARRDHVEWLLGVGKYGQ